MLEGRHVRRSRNMHGFIYNDVPSALAGSSGFSTDGERLLVSTASEAAIEQGNVVQCGPRWRTRSERIDQRWSDARAGMRDPRPVTRARPGGFCGTIHVPISVWVIRVMSWGWSKICSLSEMTLPEKKWCGFWPRLAGHVRGQGQSECPIQVMTLRFGVAPLCESYKGRSGPSAFLSPSSLCPTSPRPASCCLDSASSPPT